MIATNAVLAAGDFGPGWTSKQGKSGETFDGSDLSDAFCGSTGFSGADYDAALVGTVSAKSPEYTKAPSARVTNEVVVGPAPTIPAHRIMVATSPGGIAAGARRTSNDAAAPDFVGVAVISGARPGEGLGG